MVELKCPNCDEPCELIEVDAQDAMTQFQCECEGCRSTLTLIMRDAIESGG